MSCAKIKVYVLTSPTVSVMCLVHSLRPSDIKCVCAAMGDVSVRVMCLCARVCSVRACARARARVCVCVRARASVCVCVGVVEGEHTSKPVTKKLQRERERYRERQRERGRENSLFTRVVDKHVCFFYIQPSPKQGTALDLIIHAHIF